RVPEPLVDRPNVLERHGGGVVNLDPVPAMTKQRLGHERRRPDHDVGGSQPRGPAHGDQVRRPGARTDEGDHRPPPSRAGTMTGARSAAGRAAAPPASVPTRPPGRPSSPPATAPSSRPAAPAAAASSGSRRPPLYSTTVARGSSRSVFTSSPLRA